jgi:cytochrome b561
MRSIGCGFEHLGGTLMTIESEVKQLRIYSPTAKWMHWGFIAVFAYGVIKQVDEVEELADFTLLMNEVLFTVLFLSILLVRYIYMRTVSAAMPPLNMPRRLILLAKIVQQGMYVSLTLIAMTGLAIGGLYYSGVKEGALLEAVLLAHEGVYWASVNLMGVHIAGALYHRFKGDGVWDAMVPFFKEKA